MCTIRVTIFVLRTNVMPANIAGVGRIYFRTPEDNGKGRVVMAIIIVVNFVTVFRSQRKVTKVHQIISTSLEENIVKKLSSRMLVIIPYRQRRYGINCMLVDDAKSSSNKKSSSYMYWIF